MFIYLLLLGSMMHAADQSVSIEEKDDYQYFQLNDLSLEEAQTLVTSKKIINEPKNWSWSNFRCLVLELNDVNANEPDPNDPSVQMQEQAMLFIPEKGAKAQIMKATKHPTIFKSCSELVNSDDLMTSWFIDQGHWIVVLDFSGPKIKMALIEGPSFEPEILVDADGMPIIVFTDFYFLHTQDSGEPIDVPYTAYVYKKRVMESMNNFLNVRGKNDLKKLMLSYKRILNG